MGILLHTDTRSNQMLVEPEEFLKNQDGRWFLSQTKTLENEIIKYHFDLLLI